MTNNNPTQARRILSAIECNGGVMGEDALIAHLAMSVETFDEIVESLTTSGAIVEVSGSFAKYGDAELALG